MEDTAPRFTAQIIPLDEEMRLIAKVFEDDHPEQLADTDALIARALELADDPSYR